MSLFFLFFITSAHAWSEQALKTVDPFAFSPNDLSLQSFSLGKEVQWQWIEGSLEWVRIDKKFVIPRAKVRLKVGSQAKVTYQKQIYFPALDGTVEVPVVLSQARINGQANQIEVQDPSSNQIYRAPITFEPANLKTPLSLDPSCSPYISQISVKLSRSWVYLVCKAIHSTQHGSTGIKLDVDLYWEMKDSPTTIQVNHREIKLEDELTTSIAVDSRVSKFLFTRRQANQDDSFELEIKVAEKFHPLSVALGLGPYSHQDEIRVFATLYASYYMNETMKLAAFGAAPVRKNPELDIGFYLITEQFKGLDERLAVNLLLGAHTLSFVASGERKFSFSAPQGIEFIFRDFLLRRQNFSFGGFFYPVVNDRSYVNTWVRYGAATFFELNFIQWREPNAGDSYSAKSFGLSVGFPLFRAL